MIEIEIVTATFSKFVQLLLSAAPIPVPTLGVLGSDRLIRDLAWEPVSISGTPPFIVPPGVVPAQVKVKIQHVSIAELSTNPFAQGAETNANVWLLISATPDSLQVDVLRIEAANGQSQVFSPPLTVASRSLKDLTQKVPVTGAAIVWNSDIVTLRFGTTSGDNLLLPPADRLSRHMDRGDWLFRVDGNVFADQILAGLLDSLKTPPEGTSIEDPASATWSFLEKENVWGVHASVGLKKKDACHTVWPWPGDNTVDVSVTLNLDATFTPNIAKKTYDLRLRISSDASDWDSFRCWLGTGAIASLLLPNVAPSIILSAARIASLVAVGEIIRTSAGEAITGTHGKGDDLKEVASDDTSVTYEGTMPLPSLPTSDTDGPTYAEVGPDGLIVNGTIHVYLATHEPLFDPNGGTLTGSWQWHFNCKARTWEASFGLPGVMISDEACIGPILYAHVPVQVFPTSTLVAQSRWETDLTKWIINIPTQRALNQFVTFDVIDPLPGGATTQMIIHTSAGIRRFDIAPVPPAPPQPSISSAVMLELHCRQWMKEWLQSEEVIGRPDPPPFDYGHQALRQWLLTIEQLPKDISLTVRTYRQGTETGSPIEVRAEQSGAVTIELVTDAETSLRIEHTMKTPLQGVRLIQRWLLPIQVVELPEPVTMIARVADTIGVLTSRRLVTTNMSTGITHELAVEASGLAIDRGNFVAWGKHGADRIIGLSTHKITHQRITAVNHNRDDQLILFTDDERLLVEGNRLLTSGEDGLPPQAHPTGHSPFSITLNDGKVAAIWGNKLLIALPWGMVAQEREA
jgi:hypothetical protein